MSAFGIAVDALEFALATSRDTHPYEFMAYLETTDARNLDLGRDGEVITEVVFMPGTSSSPVSASVPEYATPIGGRGGGSVHSHPNGVLEPSDEDLRSFEAGNVHIIVGYPYRRGDWRAFDADGNEVNLEVLEVDLPDEDIDL